MSNDDTALRKEFEAFKKMATREIEAQAKAIRKLQSEIDGLKKEDIKLRTHVERLLKKAEGLINTKVAALRRTQVIDRQRFNDLDSEVSNLSRNKK